MSCSSFFRRDADRNPRRGEWVFDFVVDSQPLTSNEAKNAVPDRHRRVHRHRLGHHRHPRPRHILRSMRIGDDCPWCEAIRVGQRNSSSVDGVEPLLLLPFVWSTNASVDDAFDNANSLSRCSIDDVVLGPDADDDGGDESVDWNELVPR